MHQMSAGKAFAFRSDQPHSAPSTGRHGPVSLGIKPVVASSREVRRRDTFCAEDVFMGSNLNESYLPHYRLRSVLDLARTVVEIQPLDVAAATLLVARINSLAGPLVEWPARKAAVALEAARAKPNARHGVMACYAIMDLVKVAEDITVPRLH